MDKWALKACMAYEANDPFEYTPQAKDESSPIDLSARAAKGSPPPFISFSRNITSAALWGHYADSGKGVCLVFCFPCKNFNTKMDVMEFADAKETRDLNPIKNKLATANIVKVKYQKERVPFPENGNEQEMLAWFNKLLTTKGTTWGFEEEYRLITNYKYADIATNGMLLYSWPMTFLLGVVTGPLCPFSPQYMQKLLLDKYKKSGMSNFYMENYNIFNKEFIVSPAKYHWKNFEIEAAPWFDRLHNIGALNAYLHYVAMLNNVQVPTIDMDSNSLYNAPLIKSWNDFMLTQDSDINSVLFTSKADPNQRLTRTDKISNIFDRIRTIKASGKNTN